jgi:hypothetical protein
LKTKIKVPKDVERLAVLLQQIAWETRHYGSVSLSGVKAYARGYGIKPKELDEILVKMHELKLIVVEQE